MFKIKIINPKGVIYEGQAAKLFLCGDKGEFEILDFHRPIISILNEWDILIDGQTVIPITKGILRFAYQEAVVLIGG